jgi:S-adenosylmethionine uptake transporter
MALICSFASMKAIGIGDSSFLNSSSGVFVAVLGPLVLRQKNSRVAWVAVAGSMVGLFLLFQPRLDDALPYGRTLGLASGLFAAAAYLMIARAGRSNSPRSIVFYFALVATCVHLAAFAVLDIQWPTQPLSYVMLVAAGLVASAAQIFLTRSYQNAPAAYCAAVSYLAPVASMVIGFMIFKDVPDSAAWAGAAIVLACGVVLPFAQLSQASRRSRRAAVAATVQKSA